MGSYIDFRWIVSEVDVAAVLSGLEVRGQKPSGDGQEIRFCCPLHDDKNASASINVSTRKVLCHACGVRGDILELASQALNTNKREAAATIAEWGGCTLAPPRNTAQNGQKAPPGAVSGASGRKVQQARPSGRVRALRRPNNSPAQDPETEEPPEWQPYRKALALDTDHAFGAERFTPEIIEEFRMGFQNKGMFQNRWCIPIDDDAGEQLGYTGRYVGKQVPRDQPKWLLPSGFPKQSVLFNLHRVLDEDGRVAGGRLIVTEGPTDAIRLHSLYLPVVALLGHAIGDDQLALLERCEVSQIALLLDSDEAGRNAAPGVVERLSRVAFVRDVVLPDGDDAESVDVEFLEECLWW